MINILKAQSLHIGILGKRNVGKSSIMNYISGQSVSIVSDYPGTTTDVVEKRMELRPIGPVVFIDTAGIDDFGNLGKQRIQKTFETLNRMDLAIIICDYNGIDEFEISLTEELKKRNTPFCILINKNDVAEISDEKLKNIKKYTDKILSVNTFNNNYINSIKSMIIDTMPDNFFQEENILDEIIETGDVIVNVIPVDKEAPKGRLILPQVRTIRNIIDNSAISVVTRNTELEKTLKNLKTLPKLVITDSQVFKEVEEKVPNNILLTSYSIAFAKLKGDLKIFVQGAKKISELQNGDKILICESCTHQPSCVDIGRVKIPKLLEKFTGKKFEFNIFAGHDFPSDITDYALILHCGGCMTNKKEILSRIILAKENSVPITNYGIAIAYCLGILNRAIKPFLE